MTLDIAENQCEKTHIKGKCILLRDIVQHLMNVVIFREF